jgi:hypothetical protein
MIGTITTRMALWNICVSNDHWYISLSGPFLIYDLSPGLQQSKTTVSVVELELLILPEHMRLLTVLSGIRVGRSLVFLHQTEHMITLDYIIYNSIWFA